MSHNPIPTRSYNNGRKRSWSYGDRLFAQLFPCYSTISKSLSKPKISPIFSYLLLYLWLVDCIEVKHWEINAGPSRTNIRRWDVTQFRSLCCGGFDRDKTFFFYERGKTFLKLCVPSRINLRLPYEWICLLKLAIKKKNIYAWLKPHQ